jgi:hypothetical protein
MEDLLMLDALLLTQDGGNFGDMKVDSLSTKKERYWKFKTKTLTLMLNKETSWSTIEEVTSDNNGRLSMLMSIPSQRKVN